MKVSSKDLYGTLRAQLAPVMKKAGFKRLQTGKLGWYRPEGNRYAMVLVQCDKWGWFPAFGSKFSLEFELGTEPSIGSCSSVDLMWSFGRLLAPEEREMVRVINNGVLESLPPPQSSDTFQAMGEDWQKMFLLDYQIRVQPYSENELIWLHYFTQRDVEAWGSFFMERIPRMVSDFLVRISKS